MCITAFHWLRQGTSSKRDQSSLMRTLLPRVLVTVYLALGATSAVFAHKYLPPPGVPGATTVIPNIAISRAAYRRLTPDFPVDLYRFHARVGEPIYIQMTIPKIPALADFSPSFAIISYSASWDASSPGVLERGDVEIHNAAIRGLLGLHHGQYALTVVSNGAPPVPFHEPFTGTDYWLKQTIRIAAPATGSYEIAVFDAQGRTGKYVLATGQREDFTLRDLFELPKVRRIVRRFMEVK